METGRVIESMGYTWKVHIKSKMWYAESDGGLWVGPCDSEEALGEAVWRDTRDGDGPDIGADVPGGGAI